MPITRATIRACRSQDVLSKELRCDACALALPRAALEPSSLAHLNQTPPDASLSALKLAVAAAPPPARRLVYSDNSKSAKSGAQDLHHSIAGVISRHAKRDLNKLPRPPAKRLEPDLFLPPAQLHAALLNPRSEHADEAMVGHSIVYSWWPRSKLWTEWRLVERSARSIAACRPGIDLVVLPDLPQLRSLFEHWRASYGLLARQVCWIAPRLDLCCPTEKAKREGRPPPLDAASWEPAEDASAVALANTLAVLADRFAPAARGAVHVYHSHLSNSVAARITSFGFGCLGDADEHPMLGSLEEAKAWLHPAWHVSSRVHPSSILDAIAAGHIAASAGARVPRGFIVGDPAEQRAAFALLKNQDPTMKLVLKPSDGLGCKGLVLDAQLSDLHAETALPQSMIIEEMVGESGGPSPTIYMCGTRVLAIADQLMMSLKNNGNIVPSELPSTQLRAMSSAAVAIGEHLGLKGQWGMDFVIDQKTQLPVIVDLNVGRPNGSLAYYLWRSLQRPPAGHEAGAELVQLARCRRPLKTEHVDTFVALLAAHNLLWTNGCAEGICVTQHIPGDWSTILCASWRGRDAALALYARLAELDHSGCLYGYK
ncbi:hypothetical protein T492DRAFT_880256 [Pavlovales sp. CCMP2436]|nr:hypothetical protein T492DRAFT_880256 [Pavlovales sp. CCMP2436]